ncbi:MAG: hypothetical protein ACOX56_06160 [Acholeplasmataceae bacterium]|jgi:rubredoxin
MKIRKLLIVLLAALVFVLVSCDDTTPDPEHTHNIGSEWKTSETEHWKVCDGCDELFEKAAHTFDEGVVTKAATETETGTKKFTCTVCGYEKTEVIPKLEHTHTYSTDWTSDATHHWHASTCGHEVVADKAAHTFDAGVVTKAATETETGTKKFTCTVCGYEKTETIPKLEHTHTYSTDWTSDATHHWHASTCGHDVVSEKGEHNFEVTKTVAATCEAAGYKVHTCKVCQYTYNEPIEKLAHTLTKHPAVEATCTTGGNSEYYSCSVCNKYFSDAEGNNEIEKNSWLIDAGHVLNRNEAIEATISSPGQIEHWVCSVCGKKFSDATGTTEITDVTIPQLVASISQIKTAEIGDELIVRGVVVGYAGTAATFNLRNMMLLKDENSNDTIGLCSIRSTGEELNTVLETALGTSSTDIGKPYPQGTIIEIPVTYTKSPTNYANGQAQIPFLLFTDRNQEIVLDDFNKGTATNFAYDYTAEDIVPIANQSDFFKFMGLANGSNDPESEEYGYDVQVAAGNAFKLIKFTNGFNTIPYGPSSATYESQYYRIAVDSTVTSFSKQIVSPKGVNGAKQNFSPVFRNYNTFINTGKTFSELVYGITEKQASGSYTSPLEFDGVVYAMFIGGNDYYAQFIIIDEAAVIPNVTP